MNRDENKALIQRSKDAPEITAYLELYNEGHEVPYSETVTASPFVLFCRARDIVEGLGKTLPRGSWSVRIEKANEDGAILDWDFVTVNDSGVFDRFWNEIVIF